MRSSTATQALAASSRSDAPTASASGTTSFDDAQLPLLRQRLLRRARVAVHDPSLAEDLVQDTLVAALEQRVRFRRDASPVTWMTAILKNKIADWYRSAKRKRTVQLVDEADQHANPDLAAVDGAAQHIEVIADAQQPDGRAERRQMMGVLDRCLSRLPRQTGRVFMMREWLGFETAEICQRLGITAENCRVILHRARAGLRSCMGGNC